MGSNAAEHHAPFLDTIRYALETRIEQGDLKLPVLSAAVQQVIAMTNSEDVSAAQISAVIHGDQSLAGHILRVANSPFYLPSVQVVSLQQAIARLGQVAISEIAVSLAVKGMSFNIKGFEDEVRCLWKHAAVAGGFSREIARQLRQSVESAFLCGLLQNVGKPVILQTVRDLEAELAITLEHDDILLLMEEYHPQVGSRLSGVWCLPDVVSETIYYHHDYDNSPSFGAEARMVALSDLLAQTLIDDPGEDAWEAVTKHPAFGEINMYPDDVAVVLARRDEIREMAEAWS